MKPIVLWGGGLPEHANPWLDFQTTSNSKVTLKRILRDKIVTRTNCMNMIKTKLECAKVLEKDDKHLIAQIEKLKKEINLSQMQINFICQK